MYEVKEAILGFEKYSKVKIEKSSDFLSTIIFDEEEFLSIHITNAKYLKNITFDLSAEMIESLHIKDSDSFDIYFTMLIQDPINQSVLNLGAPILINEKLKLIAQFVTSDNFSCKTIEELSVL